MRYFVKTKSEIENLLLKEINEDDSICLIFQDKTINLSNLSIPCNFTVCGLFNQVKDLSFLPKSVLGLLSFTEIRIDSCVGMPETIGGIYIDGSCSITSWLGFNNTYITSDDNVQRLLLPTDGVLKYHPHSFKKLHSLVVSLPSDITNYIDSDFWIKSYLNSKERNDHVHDVIVEMLFEDIAISLLETI